MEEEKKSEEFENHVVEKRRDRPYQAFRILQFAFAFLAIVAGLDKFFYFLADWSQYLSLAKTDWSQYISAEGVGIIQTHKRLVMYVVGIIEVIVGLGIIFKPKYFAYVVAVWLLAIVINLFLHGNYHDIALRDIGLLLSAVALGRLSQHYT